MKASQELIKAGLLLVAIVTAGLILLLAIPKQPITQLAMGEAPSNTSPAVRISLAPQQEPKSESPPEQPPEPEPESQPKPEPESKPAPSAPQAPARQTMASQQFGKPRLDDIKPAPSGSVKSQKPRIQKAFPQTQFIKPPAIKSYGYTIFPLCNHLL